ncbi:hypothetical protein [Thermococcus sp. MAR1]|uniref:hypothetical protein n=1 Tax=Thermococcus sp. MAR1 TaxID=1638263 RepID=UPI0014399098|nr:hypothetical protein [Thermococcus sp. MAR1]NJE09332.1 hypothetical protein [Thermococcus sp. MAR1]
MQRLIIGLLLVGIAVLAVVFYKDRALGVLGMFGDKTTREVAKQQEGYDYYYFAPLPPSGTEIPVYNENGTYVAYIEFKSPMNLDLNATAPVSATFPIRSAKVADKSYDNTTKIYIYKVRIELNEVEDGFIGNRYLHLVLSKEQSTADGEGGDIDRSWLNDPLMLQYYTAYFSTTEFDTTTDSGLEIFVDDPSATASGVSSINWVGVNNETLNIDERRTYAEPFELELQVDPSQLYSLEFVNPSLAPMTSENNSIFILVQVYATYSDDNTTAPMYIEFVPAASSTSGYNRVSISPAESWDSRPVHIKVNFISLVPNN